MTDKTNTENVDQTQPAVGLDDLYLAERRYTALADKHIALLERMDRWRSTEQSSLNNYQSQNLQHQAAQNQQHDGGLFGGSFR